MQAATLLAIVLVIPAHVAADIVLPGPRPQPDEMSALEGLEHLVGNSVSALSDDFLVLKKYIEKQSMLQTGSRRMRRAESKVAAEKPQMIKLLKDMMHRFRKSADEVGNQEKSSRDHYVSLLSKRVKGRPVSAELRAKAKVLRESQRKKYHALLQLSHDGMKRTLDAMRSIEKQTKYQNKRMEEQNPLVPLGALESPQAVMAGVNHDLHRFAMDSLVQLHKTAPDVEEEVQKEKMADVYIHDGFGAAEKEDVKKEKEVKANKDLRP